MTVLFIKTTLLLLMLLNPFLLIMYVLDIVQEYGKKEFSRVLVRAGVISFLIFVLFVFFGDLFFGELLQARFESFQIFGGVVFLIIGIRFVFLGNKAMEGLRGAPKHISASIAIPIMVGPATISAAIIAGKRLGMVMGMLSIAVSLVVSVLFMVLLKHVHDFVRPKREVLIRRYMEIAGKMIAIVVGTFSVEMIMQGITRWLAAGTR